MSFIIYEDNHLLVANKPGGLATQPSGDLQSDSLELRCKALIKARDNKKGNVYLHALHRLDKAATGLVLFAKSSKALSRLNASMRAGLFEKRYLAKVEGRLPEKEGELCHRIAHRSHRAELAPDGKECRLHYRVREESEEESLVEILLKSGRYHQIRVQMSAIGCPIVGDSKYGARRQWELGAIALQHYRLSLPHPVTGQTLLFELPPAWPLGSQGAAE